MIVVNKNVSKANLMFIIILVVINSPIFYLRISVSTLSGLVGFYSYIPSVSVIRVFSLHVFQDHRCVFFHYILSFCFKPCFGLISYKRFIVFLSALHTCPVHSILLLLQYDGRYI